MAWKTNSLSKTLETINAKMSAIKRMASAAITRMAANDTSAESIAGVRLQAKIFKADVSSLAATPGLAEYVQAEVNDDQYDAIAAYLAVIAAIDAIITHIEAAVPDDDNGHLLIESWDTSSRGDRTPVTFSPAQTATLRTLMQSLVDNID